MIYDNEMKDRVDQIKKDLEEEKAAHAATLYETAKLRETLDEIGYKPLSVIKNEAYKAGMLRAAEIAYNSYINAVVDASEKWFEYSIDVSEAICKEAEK